MNYFTINDIVNLSGIKAHTLRVWEQRYQILSPKRKESKHRYYDNEDLKEILRIAWLNRNGYKISRIAQMSRKQMIEICSDTKNADEIKEVVFDGFLQAISDLDETAFQKAMQTPLLHLGFERTVLEIFYPLLERIGQNWMSDKTRPVQEHFASEQIKRKILAGIQSVQLPDDGPLTVLFTPVDELHEIPLLVIQYFLKKKGTRIAYLGTGASFSDLEYYVNKTPVFTLHFHLITHFSYSTPLKYVEELLQRFPLQQLVVSGPVAAQIKIYHPRFKLLTSMQQLLDYCGYKPKY
ncbi:MAG: MerR family transcriptional regulator [Bacteroidota bacterium]